MGKQWTGSRRAQNLYGRWFWDSNQDSSVILSVAWSIYRLTCTLQPGQHTDRAARHSLVNIPTELHVTAWSIYRPSGTSQPGQHTDRPARHSLVNIPTDLHVTAWSTYRPSCTSQPGHAVRHERVELYLYSHYGPYGLYRA